MNPLHGSSERLEAHFKEDNSQAVQVYLLAVLHPDAASFAQFGSYVQGRAHFSRHAFFRGRAAFGGLGLVIAVLEIGTHAPARHAVRGCEAEVADFDTTV